jgi:hypothetical protein
MAKLVHTGEVLHKRKQVEFDVEDANDILMYPGYDDRQITPQTLVVSFEQHDSDEVVAATIRVQGPIRKRRGEGYLKNMQGEVDFGAYWLTRDKLRERMKDGPVWVTGQLLAIWPDSL